MDFRGFGRRLADLNPYLPLTFVVSMLLATPVLVMLTDTLQETRHEWNEVCKEKTA
jgi:hypothetical protein